MFLEQQGAARLRIALAVTSIRMPFVLERVRRVSIIDLQLLLLLLLLLTEFGAVGSSNSLCINVQQPERPMNTGGGA